MENKNKLKEIDIKIRACYYFDDIMVQILTLVIFYYID